MIIPKLKRFIYPDKPNPSYNEFLVIFIRGVTVYSGEVVKI